MNNITDKIAGGSGVINLFISIITNFIDWVTSLPIGIKFISILIGVFGFYIFWEYKFGIKQTPKVIEV